MQRLTLLLPTAWATMFAGGFVGAWDLSAGGAAGRFFWNWLSARSRARVERLAATLSRHAYDASKKGLLVPAEESEG